MKIFFITLTLLLVGCATPTPQTEKLLTEKRRAPVLIDVPFIKQEENHCGPAAMGMMFQYLGKKTPTDKLSGQMFTNKMQGTFQSEMLSVTRRNGLLALPVNDLESLLKLIDAKKPVIVFQNLALESLPMWHYAVVVGHDLKGPDIILHSGKIKNQKMDLRLFERTWGLGSYWGLSLFRPDELSPVHSELQHMKAASMLEEFGKLSEAEIAYKTILSRWNKSETALLGLANIYYRRKNLAHALRLLQKAARYRPRSPYVWHNLAIVQRESGRTKEAQTSAMKAMALVGPEQKAIFHKNLKRQK